jgi:hypothetical protein
VRDREKNEEGTKARTNGEVLKTRERRGGLACRGRGGERGGRERDSGLSQFRPLLFVFGSARADQTTDDQNSIPANIPFLANFLSPL